MPTWAELEAEIAAQPWGTDKTVRRGTVPHPREAGYRRDRGWPKGQDSDWRKLRPDGSGFHVRVYPDRFELHVDDVDPGESMLGHTRADLPVVFLLAGTAIGAGAGYAVSKRRKRSGALVGALAAWTVAAIVAAQGGRKA